MDGLHGKNKRTRTKLKATRVNLLVNSSWITNYLSGFEKRKVVEVEGQANHTIHARTPRRGRSISRSLILTSLFFAALVSTTSCQNAVAFQDVSEKLRAVQSKYTKEIRPLLETHCGDCHWGDNADADLNLEKYVTLDQLLEGRDKWRKVMVRMAAKEMPPEDNEPLADDDHANVLAWLDNCLLYTSPSPRDQRGSRMPSSA